MSFVGLVKIGRIDGYGFLSPKVRQALRIDLVAAPPG